MNRSYKLDYFGTEHNNAWWLTQRVHWDNVPVQGKLQIQEYVDASLFRDMVEAKAPPIEAPEQTSTRSLNHVRGSCRDTRSFLSNRRLDIISRPCRARLPGLRARPCC